MAPPVPLTDASAFLVSTEESLLLLPPSSPQPGVSMPKPRSIPKPIARIELRFIE
jgi:hypothetical protein